MKPAALPLSGSAAFRLSKSLFDKLLQVFLRFSSAENLPSINKGRHGFDGQKCPHTASSPLRIRHFPAGLSLSGCTFLLRQNCKAPASHEFSSDFWLLRSRRVGARQGEKDKKRRKNTLAGLTLLIDGMIQNEKHPSRVSFVTIFLPGAHIFRIYRQSQQPFPLRPAPALAPGRFFCYTEGRVPKEVIP